MAPQLGAPAVTRRCGIREVVGMIVVELLEDGEKLPANVDVSEGTRVSVRA
jgi:hypothetical protein